MRGAQHISDVYTRLVEGGVEDLSCPVGVLHLEVASGHLHGNFEAAGRAVQRIV